jgi:hypothetical protein
MFFSVNPCKVLQNKKVEIFLTKDRICFLVILIFFWFGVIFYNFNEKFFGFSYTDEIIALFCAVYTVYYKIINREGIKRVSLIIFSIIIFYFVYSLLIKSNTSQAILSDLVVVVKPFIAILFIFELNPEFTDKMLKFFSVSSISASFLIAAISLIGDPAVNLFFVHPSRLALAAIISAYLYFFANKFNRKTALTFTLIMCLSLFSYRSKAYGTVVATIIPLWFLYNQIAKNRFQLQRRYLLSFVILFSLVLVVAWPKINLYVTKGTENPQNMFARSSLYITSIKVARDYFPFGSGLASYASYFSGKYYSPLYCRYGQSNIYGLTKNRPVFVADCFFPQLLGQFGVVGLLLFIFGFYLLCKDTYFSYRINKKNTNHLFLIYCILVSLAIESVADCTLVQNRGMFLMLLLGLAVQKINIVSIRAAAVDSDCGNGGKNK